MKKIGFDIDGVLTDYEYFLNEICKEFLKTNFNKDIVNINTIDIKEMFECNLLQELYFWINNITNYVVKYPVRDGMVELIKQLQEENKEIYIITSRFLTSNIILGIIMRYLVKKWLFNNNIIIDKNNFCFCSSKNSAYEKRTFCQKNKIDLIIEDTPLNIKYLSEVTNVIAYLSVYNEKFVNEIIKTNEYIFPASNSKEIYDIIKQKEKILIK